MEIGQRIQIEEPFRVKGTARLVAVIGKGSRPSQSDIQKWYGHNAPGSAYRPLSVDRLIFQREDSDGFIIIPDNPNMPIPGYSLIQEASE